MLKGCLVKTKKDIVVDKYCHGYTTFPEGSLFTYKGLSDDGLNKVFSPVDIIEIEQPKRVFLDNHEFEVVEGCKTDTSTKELLLRELSNINPNKHDIRITRNTDYSLSFSTTSPDLKCVTYISIIGDCLTATISSNDGASFSIYNRDDVFESKRYHADCEGLFKEVYNAIKHLLVIDV